MLENLEFRIADEIAGKFTYLYLFLPLYLLLCEGVSNIWPDLLTHNHQFITHSSHTLHSSLVVMLRISSLAIQLSIVVLVIACPVC